MNKKIHSQKGTKDGIVWTGIEIHSNELISGIDYSKVTSNQIERITLEGVEVEDLLECLKVMHSLDIRNLKEVIMRKSAPKS